MKAVNLIPAELRRGDSGGGHSGGLVYVVLGALAVLVVLTAAWAGFGKVAGDRKAEAGQLQAEATAIEARAGKLAHYEAAAASARERVAKVRALATSRFEWSHTFREVSRMLPNEAWVTTMIGTVAQNVSVEGGGNPLRSLENAPALELSGCTRRQDSVAKLMAQLRGMDGVTRVALSSSEKRDDAGGTDPSAAKAAPSANGDCREGSDRPKFDLVVFFRATGQAATAPGTPAATPAPGAAGATPPANGSTPPANGLTPPANGSTPPATGSTPPASGTSPTPSTSNGASQ
jgi:Tfp pilus assembly protein PilN